MKSLEKLVDSFNRHSYRASFFLWSIFTIFDHEYESWDKGLFIDFYKRNGKGISPKVVGCFLQQGFSKEEIIPNYALGGNKSMNLTFNVSALDGASVQEVLTNNQGAVVGAIRDAANSYGQDFLPDVNVGYGGDG